MVTRRRRRRTVGKISDFSDMKIFFLPMVGFEPGTYSLLHKIKTERFRVRIPFRATLYFHVRKNYHFFLLCGGEYNEKCKDFGIGMHFLIWLKAIICFKKLKFGKEQTNITAAEWKTKGGIEPKNREKRTSHCMKISNSVQKFNFQKND